MSNNFSFKNYLEPIPLEDRISQLDILENIKKKSYSFVKPYPFSKEELIDYLLDDPVLSKKRKEEKKISLTLFLEIKKKFENFPPEKKAQEIQNEKRRRFQAYKCLEYSLSSVTYFDFFSHDAFQMAKQTKILADFYQAEEVSPEFLILPFFDSSFKFYELLKSFGLDKAFLGNLINDLKKKFKKENSKFETSSPFVFFFYTFWTLLKKEYVDLKRYFLKTEVEFNQKIPFSWETHEIFQKASENAIERFKTPVITPEILLITLMEEKDLKISQLLKERITDQTSWYLLRYELLKRLYKEEINIREQVKINHHFFAYLLKISLSQKSFNKLIKKKQLSKAVLFFRRLVIRDVLKIDLLAKLKKETQLSMINSPKRYYSS